MRERPSRSCFQTMTVSPGRNNFIFLSSPGRFDFGVPLSVLQETGGWESIEMVRRYAHLASNQLSEHAQKIDAIFGNHDTNTTQGENQAGLKLA